MRNHTRHAAACAFLIAFAVLLGGGCKKKKKKYWIPFGDPPVVSTIPDQPAAINVEFSFDVAPYVTDNDNTIDELKFSPYSGSGTFDNSVYTNTFTTPGNKIVEFIVSDPGGHRVKSWLIVAVHLPPAADFAADQPVGTEPHTVQFTDTTVGAVTSWAWDLNDNGSIDSTEQNPQYTYDNVGFYTVTLTVTSPGGTDNEVKVDYIDVGFAPTANFTADSVTGKAPLNVSFTDLSAGDPATWAWDFDCNGEIDATEQNPSHVYDEAGQFSVSLTVGRPGSIDSTLTMVNYIFVSGNTWYVDDSVSVSGNGATWATAFKTIGEALGNAGNLGLVWVADGTYNEADLDFAGKSIHLQSKNGSALCIIDPQYAGRAFSFQSGEAADTIVEGFTIEYGNGFFDGGALYMDTGSPTIRSCIIRHCDAADWGGAICAVTGSNPLIIDCTIENNTAAMEGGGIYLSGSNASIINCTITKNVSLGADGGGIYCTDSFPTVLDSDILHNVVYADGGGVYCTFSEITISNCTLDNNTSEDYGGGICLDSSFADITNCTITNNSCLFWDGGGIHTQAGSNASITDSDVSYNYADFNGGGISAAMGSYLHVSNCSITFCTALWGGGGISGWLMEDLSITDCEFDNNVAGNDNGGGLWSDDCVYAIDNCNFTNNYTDNGQWGGGGYIVGYNGAVTNCTFSNNTSTGRAGGLRGVLTDMTLENCVFNNNYAVEVSGGLELSNGNFQVINCFISSNYTAMDGGGVYINGGNVSMTTCIIDNNTASSGGGAYINGGNSSLINCVFISNTASSEAGGIMCRPGTTALIINCMIANNTALYTGGLYCSDSSPTVVNSTISNNTGTSRAGGVYSQGGAHPVLRNTILYGNISSNGSEIHIWDTSSYVTLSYCCFDNGAGCVDGDGKANLDDTDNNITSDPQLVPVILMLSPTSPCIDAGLNAHIDSLGITEDLLGNPRKMISITGIPGGDVDIGAFEYQP
ncbi:MAG: PKD domain-containing protein [Planctomycetota bacterium]|nr:MAG: PKD domain-containing protein [Planctomycetota bacterium]